MNLTGRVDKFMDIDRAPGCKVKYHVPTGVTQKRDGWRPLWINQNNPYQYDKMFNAKQEHARARATEERTRRLLAGGRMSDTAPSWNGDQFAEKSGAVSLTGSL